MRIGLDVSARHGFHSGTAVYTSNPARALLELDDGPDLVLYFSVRRLCRRAERHLDSFRRDAWLDEVERIAADCSRSGGCP